MNKYLKVEYWNECDLGFIYYQGGQHFWFYLDADVSEPQYEEVEEGKETEEGEFVATYKRQVKKYIIRTGLLPEFLVDMLYRMKLHDHILLTFKTGEVEYIKNVEVTHEWAFTQKQFALVTIKFDMDEKVIIGGCCTNLS